MITRYRNDNRQSQIEGWNKLMNEFFGEPSELRSGWVPSVDIKESSSEITFYMEVPGVRQEDIDVELVGDLLTVKGRREMRSEEKKDDFVRIERSYGSFQRSFSIGVPVKADQISANYKDGILTVTVPKADEVQPRKINISAQ